MDGLYLTSDQIEAGAATLLGSSEARRLKVSQIDDLISICRKYLRSLATNYPLRSTFEALRDDDVENNKCAKLAACLLLWQDVQFDNTAFEATNANKTGFTDSTVKERFDIFEYVFGLFWDLPESISASAMSQFTSRDGFFDRYGR